MNIELVRKMLKEYLVLMTEITCDIHSLRLGINDNMRSDTDVELIDSNEATIEEIKEALASLYL